MPKVLPLTSEPSQNMGWCEIFQLPSRTHLSLSTTRRATASSSPNARSAVDLASTPGVYPTNISRLVASGMSTLSSPTAT